MKPEKESAARPERSIVQIAKVDGGKSQALRFISIDKIAGLLGECPELTKAVRDGDVSTVSVLCAKLFESVANMHNPRKRSLHISFQIF